MTLITEAAKAFVPHFDEVLQDLSKDHVMLT